MLSIRSLAALLMAATPSNAMPTNVTVVSMASYEMNCKGSGLCGLYDYVDDCMTKIRGYLEHAVDLGFGYYVYQDHQYIACYQECCAFYQNGASGTVGMAHGYLSELVDFGCKGCGSAPSGGGEFTINYVAESPNCLDGHLCAPKEGYACDWDLKQDPTEGYSKDQICDLKHETHPPPGCGWPLTCHLYGPEDPGDPYYTGDDPKYRDGSFNGPT